MSFNKITFKSNLNSRRLHKENDDARSPFQRDRDRIIHSNAFRRLAHKTQVFFTNNKHDHYRTRLTHSLEVSQISRSINSILGGDENLTESIALSHDLGHPPFGHVGENILNTIMHSLKNNGFNHNIQTLRIVTFLEQKYALFDGLNLTYGSLEGILKHSGPINKVDDLNSPYYINFSKNYNISLNSQSSLESQIAAISDDVAYNCHDIDDGFRAGLFDLDDLMQLELIREKLEDIYKINKQIETSRIIHELKRSLINALVMDIIKESQYRVKKYGIASYKDIVDNTDPIVVFSHKMELHLNEIRTFLGKNMYQNKKITEDIDYAQVVIEGLFYFYKENLNKLPLKSEIINYSELKVNRVICDFISGMTDNYAIEKYKELIL
ncbi:MAG: deoxyguanosinetriphosphate triphosphohydrolase family protein [Alphaproteobacteria bacterium]|uniref:Deoxyguanosinetriphosphate triphosphohydrolase-like protein n=1 Tax=PS1 clade bacterium TaxID=2175152 RepID=A0A368DJN8_9PROT|nr:MAG: dNTP triphosphohydrolase [PS1 clade bacterium]|tara:strand:+ start:3165 stop:4310 length:1146 start_codon:yes stop_codon:yes gene_type:complete